MIAGTSIDWLVTRATRHAQSVTSRPDDEAPDRDARHAAWQSELDQARASPAESKTTAAIAVQRDALAAFAATLDPLLLSLSAAKGDSAPRHDVRSEAKAQDDRPGPRAARAESPQRASNARHGKPHFPASSNDRGDVDANDRVPAGVDPDAARRASTGGDGRATAGLAVVADTPDADTGAASAAARQPTISMRQATLRMWPFTAGAANSVDAADVAALLPGPADDPAPTSARLRAAMVDATQPQAPIRLHVEWGAAGARVWLGLDAGSADATAQIVDSVARCLNRVGARLRSVVCNGVNVPLVDDGPTAVPRFAHATALPVDLLFERTPSWPPSAP